MNSKCKYGRRLLAPMVLLAGSGALMGCPSLGFDDYDLGFEAGFAVDQEYWQGYDDSWDTRDGGEIYYTGHLIPELTDGSYDAGYYDGVWFAYNDGYFVAYDYAFTIGFSEGYDAAFASDWLPFIENDTHVEWLDGGFSDGYNDGFSEGRMLGAVDYLEGLPFDWLDAMNFYRAGEDVYIPELDLGTGEYGPVWLYEYGTNPFDLIKGAKVDGLRSLRGGKYAKQDQHEISYRPLPTEVTSQLSVRPEASARGNRELRLTTTWLERINEYNAQYEKADTPRPRPNYTVQ